MYGADSSNPFYKYLTREDKEHVMVVNYMKSRHPEVICFHVPNEGTKSNFERYKYSIMGALSGVSDFVILKPKYVLKRDLGGEQYRELIYHGMLIELKAPSEKRVVMEGKNAGKVRKIAEGKMSDHQIEFLERCNKEKYYGICCVGFENAVKEIEGFLSK